MNRIQVVNSIKQIAKESLPPNSKLLLYGSRARGDARPDSDWDLLILLDKDRITLADIDEVSYPMRELGWRIDEVLNPVIYTFKEWESKNFTPFYKNVMEEGVAL
ncbi:MAG: nucleotidyltransferase domain-containing protein [Bacteroidaceae bacterium]|nr:nucleotidyltransferase domain-containing protein [Bacteroidaceae bacterium]